MRTLDWFCLFLAAAAVLLSLAAVVQTRLKNRRILNTLNEMLDSAVRGDFQEDRFDESLLSSVESRLMNYLAASNVSARNLQAEKDKIKELIADISHQTKTPIANILLYAQLLGEQTLPQQSRECVTALNQQAEKLSFLIGSLVKTSRLETGILTLHPHPAAVGPMLQSAEQELRRRADARGVALTVLPTEESAVFDPKWTGEALVNLMDNAVKYTPAGGSVTVRTCAYQLFTRIDVEDTGIGIAEEELSRIFQRFYRSPAVSDREGVGIGLFLSRQIVSGQGGYIKVSSRVGRGSVFSIFLPREV